MIDPEIAPLVSRRKDEVQKLVEHPLVGGKWVASAGSPGAYMFFPDGSLWQERGGRQHRGRWVATGDELRLLNRSENLPDSMCSFEFAGDSLSQLILSSNGTQYAFRRDERSLVKGCNLANRKLEESGAWQWTNGQPSYFNRVSAIRLLDQPKRQFWFSNEHPLFGKVDQLINEE